MQLNIKRQPKERTITLNDDQIAYLLLLVNQDNATCGAPLYLSTVNADGFLIRSTLEALERKTQ